MINKNKTTLTAVQNQLVNCKENSLDKVSACDFVRMVIRANIYTNVMNRL